jgi:hypothetical protein
MATTQAATSLSKKPIQPHPGRQWNTLEILKASRIGILALLVLLLIAVATGARVHRSAMQTIGRDTASGIIAAQHIKAAVADMDADAADELLAPPNTVYSSIKGYEDQRFEAARALIAAAGDVVFGESELTPILAVQTGLGSYERLVQKARDLHQERNSSAVDAYFDAASLMDVGLLPAADLLDQANDAILERTYHRQTVASFLARAFVAAAGAAALLALLAAQVFLSQRMKRTLNPLLLTATLITVGLTAYSLEAMGGSEHQLKVAREDAFTSINALWKARAIAYEAKSDESRYLLDPARAADPQRSFPTQAALVARPPEGMTPEQLLTSVRAGGHVDGFTGYLADELNNITFPGEQEAAYQTLANWEQYLEADRRVRQIESAGQHQQAVSLSLGTESGQAVWAFNQFDQALATTLDINQHAFDASVSQGLSALSGLEIASSIMIAFTAALVILGLAPRIREYE